MAEVCPLTWQYCPVTPVCPRRSVWPGPPPASGPALSSSHSPAQPHPGRTPGLTRSWTSQSFSSAPGGCWPGCWWAGGRSSHCLETVSAPLARPPPPWPAGSHWSHGSWGSCSWARTDRTVLHCWPTRSPSWRRTAGPASLWGAGGGGGRSHHDGPGGSRPPSAGSETTSQGQSGSGPKPASHHQGPG